MKNIRDSINGLITQKIWRVDVNSLGRLKGFLIRSFRFVHVMFNELTDEQLTLRAMSLVYTTLLSMVPLLAVSFSVLKAFGVHTRMEIFLYHMLEPFGPKGIDLSMRIISFVENVRVGVLGSIGLSLLFYTVISLIKKIESSLNYIWKIKRPRSFARRFSDYMSVILLGPVLIFSALGISASVMSSVVVEKLISIEPFGTVVYASSKIMPYILVCAAFTFIYIFVPNIKVRLRSALVGGICAGVLWKTLGWAFASFIVTSTKYTAIYAGFAILIMFMLWLYISWLILLIGGQIAYYHQYPRFFTAVKEDFLLSNRLKERLALLVMYLIGYNHYHTKSPWTLSAIIERVRLPVNPVQKVISQLERNNLIMETGDDPPALLPARDIEQIRIRDVLEGIRTAEEATFSVDTATLSENGVDDVINRLDSIIGNTLGDESIRELVISGKAGDPSKDE
ncbi:MAG: YihY/virulence factor BrkB family protein [Nitrospiraceae bacterium]|nr:MAG: YihY/virulence factor BrkB family protein [Nitrospiraceae bacterium]